MCAIRRSFVKTTHTSNTKIDDPDPILEDYVESDDMWQALLNEETAYENMVKRRQK